MVALAEKLSVEVPPNRIEQFCRKYEVIEFALFGSILRDDFCANSDVDVLIRFDQSAHPTLLTVAAMEIELESIFGRAVDVVEREAVQQSKNPYRRDSILNDAEVIYAR